LAIALIMLVGLAVRIYRLDQQSITWDGANGTVCLDRDSLGEYLKAFYDPQGCINRQHVPLYFVVQYFWAGAFGRSPIALRMLPILIGVFTIPLVCLLGARLFGRFAGLAAGLFFALSPQHIYHDQSIRAYPLYVMCAVLALLALVRARGSRSPWWWVLNGAANLALLWTHIIGVLILPVEGLFLLCSGAGRKRLFWWSLAQGVLAIPTLCWILVFLRLPRTSIALTLFVQDSFSVVLKDIVGGDVLSLARIPIDYHVQEVFAASTVAVIFGVQKWADRALAAIALGSLLFCAGVLVRALSLVLSRRVSGSAATHEHGLLPAGEEKPEACEPRVLFMGGLSLALALAVLPMAFLAVLSNAWQPCYFPRYCLYSSIGVYLAIGATLACLPRKWLRAGFLAAVVSLYAGQLYLMLPSSTRTDWHKAAEYVQRKGRRGDLIMAGRADGGDGFAFADVCRLHFPVDWPVTPVHTIEEALIGCSRHFDPGIDDTGRAAGEPKAWLILCLDYVVGYALPEIEAAMPWRGLRFLRMHYPVDRGLVVYEVTADFAIRNAAAERVPPESVLASLGLSFPSPEAEQISRDYLGRRVFGPLPPIEDAERTAALAMDFQEKEGAYLMAALAEKALRMDPSLPAGYMARSMSFLLRDRQDEATADLLKALDLMGPSAQDFCGVALPQIRHSLHIGQWRQLARRLLRGGFGLPRAMLESQGLAGWVDVGQNLSTFER